MAEMVSLANRLDLMSRLGLDEKIRTTIKARVEQMQRELEPEIREMFKEAIESCILPLAEKRGNDDQD